MQNASARDERRVSVQVIRRMAHLLELAYMAVDQKKFDRCIKLCEKILFIDPRYPVPSELKEYQKRFREVLAQMKLDLLRFAERGDVYLGWSAWYGYE